MMSPSMALLLRTARVEQLEIGDGLLFISLWSLLVYVRESLVDSYPMNVVTGIKMILSEVAEQPERAARAGFLHYDMIVRLQRS